MKSSHKVKNKRIQHIQAIEQPLINIDLNFFIYQIKLRYLKSILHSKLSLLQSYCTTQLIISNNSCRNSKSIFAIRQYASHALNLAFHYLLNTIHLIFLTMFFLSFSLPVFLSFSLFFSFSILSNIFFFPPSTCRTFGLACRVALLLLPRISPSVENSRIH